jgi:hypothetical protein
MNPAPLRILSLLTCLLLPGCDEAAKMCRDEQAPLKNRISACGERCDKDDAEACVRQTELATAACLEGSDAETCRWMCHYGGTGQDLYCARFKDLTGTEAE